MDYICSHIATQNTCKYLLNAICWSKGKMAGKYTIKKKKKK